MCECECMSVYCNDKLVISFLIRDTLCTCLEVIVLLWSLIDTYTEQPVKDPQVVWLGVCS